MTTTSAIPGVMLALLEKFESLTYTLPAGEDTDTTVYVFDGIPGPNAPDNFIVLGGAQSPTVSGSQKFAGLGATQKNEDFTIEVAISCYVGGYDDGSPWSPSANTEGATSEAQMAARQNAFSIMSAIEVALQADIQLEQVTNPPTGLLWCELGTRMSIEQTAPDDPESGMGRVCSISFTIRARTRIFP